MKAFLVVALVVWLAGCGFRRGNTVVIPRDYEGWVQVHYQVPGAPELSREDGAYLIEVPDSGIAKTSSVRSQGYGQDHYFIKDARGTRKEIPSNGAQDSSRSVSNFQYFSSPAQVTVFFIGDVKKIDAYKRPAPEEFDEPSEQNHEGRTDPFPRRR